MDTPPAPPTADIVKQLADAQAALKTANDANAAASRENAKLVIQRDCPDVDFDSLGQGSTEDLTARAKKQQERVNAIRKTVPTPEAPKPVGQPAAEGQPAAGAPNPWEQAPSAPGAPASETERHKRHVDLTKEIDEAKNAGDMGRTLAAVLERAKGTPVIRKLFR